MGLSDTLPCQCTNPDCGITFQARNPVGGSGSNIQFTGNMTNCPRCGQKAYYADWHTDSQGEFHLKGFFSALRGLQDVDKLRALKFDLEAANDNVTAHELADTLVELEPGFEKFKKALSSIPANKVGSLVQTLISIITIVIMLQTWQSSDENHEENIAFQQEQFEYQKERDAKQDTISSKADQERDNLQRQIDELQKQFEEKIKEYHTQKPGADASGAHGAKLKGSCRNKPCPCGSGKKAKKCHPNGFRI